MTNERLDELVEKGVKTHGILNIPTVSDKKAYIGELTIDLFKLITESAKEFNLNLTDIIIPACVKSPVETYIALDKSDNLIARLKVSQSSYLEDKGIVKYFDCGGCTVNDKKYLVIAYGTHVLLGAI